MAVRLTDAGIEHVIGDVVFAGISWPQLTRVEATSVDHMTQRVPMLTFEDDGGELLDVGEGEAGWDELVAHLSEHLQLAVPDLSATLGMLRTGEVVRVFTR